MVVGLVGVPVGVIPSRTVRPAEAVTVGLLLISTGSGDGLRVGRAEPNVEVVVDPTVFVTDEFPDQLVLPVGVYAGEVAVHAFALVLGLGPGATTARVVRVPGFPTNGNFVLELELVGSDSAKEDKDLHV